MHRWNQGNTIDVDINYLPMQCPACASRSGAPMSNVLCSTKAEVKDTSSTSCGRIDHTTLLASSPREKQYSCAPKLANRKKCMAPATLQSTETAPPVRAKPTALTSVRETPRLREHKAWRPRLIDAHHAPIAPRRAYVGSQSRSQRIGRQFLPWDRALGRAPAAQPGDSTTRKNETPARRTAGAPFRDDDAGIRRGIDIRGSLQYCERSFALRGRREGEAFPVAGNCATRTAHRRDEPSPTKHVGRGRCAGELTRTYAQSCAQLLVARPSWGSPEVGRRWAREEDGVRECIRAEYAAREPTRLLPSPPPLLCSTTINTRRTHPTPPALSSPTTRPQDDEEYTWRVLTLSPPTTTRPSGHVWNGRGKAETTAEDVGSIGAAPAPCARNGGSRGSDGVGARASDRRRAVRLYGSAQGLESRRIRARRLDSRAVGESMRRTQSVDEARRGGTAGWDEVVIQSANCAVGGGVVAGVQGRTETYWGGPRRRRNTSLMGIPGGQTVEKSIQRVLKDGPSGVNSAEVGERTRWQDQRGAWESSEQRAEEDQCRFTSAISENPVAIMSRH
ncbi:hypothetical protein C8J57DRAFT_1227707 [Mycena rebaudengoi]|nr:hypothetical protein C8J57DRAFT_1227707 [Mycena rebaudengoi]